MIISRQLNKNRLNLLLTSLSQVSECVHSANTCACVCMLFYSCCNSHEKLLLFNNQLRWKWRKQRSQWKENATNKKIVCVDTELATENNKKEIIAFCNCFGNSSARVKIQQRENPNESECTSIALIVICSRQWMCLDFLSYLWFVTKTTNKTHHFDVHII